MKQVLGLQLALATVLTVGGAQAQATKAGNAADATPIPAVQDWSARSVIHRQPMTPDELEAAGRGDEMRELYRDPRYVAAVLRRIENEAPLAPTMQRNYRANTTASAASDRRRGHGGKDPAPSNDEGSGDLLRDWSHVLGGGTNGQGGRGTPGMYPAKYTFDIEATPSCADDFVVYPTNAAGASQSGTRQEQWSGSFGGDPQQGTTRTVTLGLAGARQVILTSHASDNTGANFQTAGVSNDQRAANLRNAANRFSQQTGFRAVGTGATVTIISNTAGDIDNGSVSEALDNDFNLTRTYPGAGTTTAGQPTLIAFNQLYQDTTPPLDGCNGDWNQNGAVKAPNVMWSYNTGTGFIVETSPVLSYVDDAKQVAFVQRSGNNLELVLLKWATGPGNGTAQAPVTPASVTAAAYRGCTAPCMTRLAFSGTSNTGSGVTYSSPYVEYGNDILWVGDGNSRLHKFTNVFKGPAAPAEETANGFPASVTTAGLDLSSPVSDGRNHVYVGSQSGAGTNDGGRVHRVARGNGATVVSSAKLSAASRSGVRESPILDSYLNKLYTFVFSVPDLPGNTPECTFVNPPTYILCRAVIQFDTATDFNASGATGLARPVGLGSITGETQALWMGAFDEAYFTSPDGTGAMYICGGNTNRTQQTRLWKVPIVAGVIQTAVAGRQIGVDDDESDGTIYNCSPATTVRNAAGNEYLYVSISGSGPQLNGTACGNNTDANAASSCLYMFQLNNLDGDATPNEAGDTTWGTGNLPRAALQVFGGTGGIVVDNVSTAPGRSQVYFTHAAPTGNAVQASQQTLD